MNYSLAVPQIAAAECDHELKCGNVGLSLKFSNMQHCTEVKTAALNEDFSQDQDCRNGILASDVDRCVAKTSQETCTGLSSVITDMEASGVCGSADLCLD